MDAKIYYFTGSGNSLAVARDLATGIQAQLIAIPSVISQVTIKAEADVIGIVFPVYHQGLPLIVKRFLEKLESRSGAYFFAVCTSGNGPALSLTYLQKQLKAKGCTLAGGFNVMMPYNYISPTSVKNFYGSFALRPTPPEKRLKMFAESQAQVQAIGDYVLKRKSGNLDTSADLLERLVDVMKLRNVLQKPVWLKAAGVAGPVAEPFPACIRWMDQGFSVLENCTGCGTCSRICPVRSIEMCEGKPHWNHHCEQCFACLQWCPNEAIQFGNSSVHGRRYHHPDVTRKDMIEANHPHGSGNARPDDSFT